MKPLTKNEMRLVLLVLKSPEKQYNASSISRELGISPMGALKIASRLEKARVLQSKLMGHARYFEISFANEYARMLASFLLRHEAEHAVPYVQLWLNEARKIKSAELAVLFGSVLNKQKQAKDIDILLVVSQNNFNKLKKEIERVNLVNVKKLHPLFQSEDDFKANVKKGDKILLSAIKGIAAFGEGKLVDLLASL
ncbi:MAG: hypothetical protein KJ955_07615 [Nanoarchaeota archaeon]|nr:hypothetical protein [Nanoarchaeota archaeon]